MSKFKDFDNAFEEKEIEDIEFKFAGKKYQVSGVMPAIIPVKMQRLREEHGDDADVPAEETFSLMLRLMDEDELEQLASDTNIEQLNEILMWILEQYSEEKEDEGKNSKKTDQK